MEGLLQQVMDKAGLDEEKAQQAIDAMMDFLRDRLPEPLAGQLEAMLGGEDGPDLGGLMDQLGGLFKK